MARGVARWGWVGLVVLMLGCVDAPRAKGDKAPAKGKPFAFKWGAGKVTIEETVEREGEVLTLRWEATVKDEGARLRVRFGAGEVVDGLADALGPKGSHPFYQIMPDLLVGAKDGRLLGIEETRARLAEQGKVGMKTKAEERALGAIATTEAVEARATERWAQWVKLVGFDAAPNTETSMKSELPSGEGLLMPVTLTTVHKKEGNVARVELTRSFSGPSVAKVYKAVLAAEGAPDAMVDAVRKVVREERYECETDPKTLRSTRIVSRELTTVHSEVKGAEKVELKAASESWTFTWGP